MNVKKKKNIYITIHIICLFLITIGGIGTTSGIQRGRSAERILHEYRASNRELGESVESLGEKLDAVRTGISNSQQRIVNITTEVSGNTERLRQGVLIVQELNRLFERLKSIVFEPDETISNETN